MREYVTRLLAPHYTVIAVANGAEALKVALSDPPELILSDVMMPLMDGFELVNELRKNAETRTIPVILLSARAGEESRVEGLMGGADDYLIKPFTARELLTRIAAHLSMRQRHAEAEAALKESQATLQSFYDSSPLLMGVAELEGDDILAIYRNAAAMRFFAPAEDHAGISAITRGSPAREIKRLWLENYRKSQREGRPVRFEYKHPKPDEVCWLRASVNYLGKGNSGRLRFSFVAEDITEHKLAEERLHRSNDELRRANADLEQFAYSASHDLQEPLRQVAVYSQLLEARFADKLAGKGLEYLAFCVEGAHRMELLISDLLAYAQATTSMESSSQLVDTNNVLAEVKKNLATTIEETGAVVTGADLARIAWQTTFPSRISSRIWFQMLSSIAASNRRGSWSPRRIWAIRRCFRWRTMGSVSRRSFKVRSSEFSSGSTIRKTILAPESDWPSVRRLSSAMVGGYGSNPKWAGALRFSLRFLDPQPPQINCGLSLDQAFADGIADEFTAIMQVQLAHQVHFMGIHSFNAQVQPGGDAFQGLPFR